MKKTDEALSKSQDQALIYRQQLEAGEIRLVPDKPSRPVKQKDEVEQQAHS
jgi:hypothetical protein